METYYKPEDLPKFEEIGKESKELAEKLFDETVTDPLDIKSILFLSERLQEQLCKEEFI